MIIPAWASAKLAVKGIWAAVVGAVILALVAAVAVQSIRLHGFHLWPISITGWIKTAGEFERERNAERISHTQTKTRYRIAQFEASRLEQERLADVQTRQQEITDAVEQDYQARLAAARARAEQLRHELRTRSAAGGASRDLAVSGVPDTAGAFDGATEDPELPALAAGAAGQLERDLTATEQAIQLDALIDWVEQQAAIDPNQSPSQ